MSFEEDFPSLKWHRTVYFEATDDGFKLYDDETGEEINNPQRLWSEYEISKACNDKAKSVTHEELREAIKEVSDINGVLFADELEEELGL